MSTLTATEIACRKGSMDDRRTVIYIWPEGENIWENLQNRRDRPHVAYRKEVLPTVLALLEIPDAKARWSQKAGCSCGCSPGFILDRTVRGDDYRVMSVHVTVEETQASN